MITKISAFLLIMAGVAGYAMAGNIEPEIDPASAGAAVAVIAGAMLVMRGRRKA